LDSELVQKTMVFLTLILAMADRGQGCDFCVKKLV
jgi:hypothetical protein